MTFTTLRYEIKEGVTIAILCTSENLNGITEARLDEVETVLLTARSIRPSAR